MVEGSVTHIGTGEPIAGVSIDVFHILTSTDNDGSYRVNDVEVGNRYVAAEMPGFVDYVEEIFVEADQTLQVDIELKPIDYGTIIMGHVLTDDGGVPIDSVMVSAAGSEDYSDVDGRYILTNLPTGNVELSAEKPGFLPHAETVSISGQDVVLDIELEKGTNLEGGEITSDVRLTEKGSPYYVYSALVVVGGKLTLEAGAELSFISGASRGIKAAIDNPDSGSLLILGTPGNPVKIRNGPVDLTYGSGANMEQIQVRNFELVNERLILRSGPGAPAFEIDGFLSQHPPTSSSASRGPAIFLDGELHLSNAIISGAALGGIDGRRLKGRLTDVTITGNQRQSHFDGLVEHLTYDDNDDPFIASHVSYSVFSNNNGPRFYPRDSAAVLISSSDSASISLNSFIQNGYCAFGVRSDSALSAIDGNYLVDNNGLQGVDTGPGPGQWCYYGPGPVPTHRNPATTPISGVGSRWQGFSD